MKLTREILRLAGPSILANITVPLVGMVDIAVVGHLGGAAAGVAGTAAATGAAAGAAAAGLSGAALIGGISVGTMLFDLLYWNFAFLRAGTGGLTAQAYGALMAGGMGAGSAGGGSALGAGAGGGVDARTMGSGPVGAILRRALRLALLSALGILLLQWVVVQAAFLVVQCSPEVQALATQYFYIRVWAAPATLSLFAFKGWFIGLQDSVRPMTADLLVNGINIVLSVLLSFGLPALPGIGFEGIRGLGFAGVALGTVIAQWSGLAYCLLAARHRYGFSLELNPLILSRLCKINKTNYIIDFSQTPHNQQLTPQRSDGDTSQPANTTLATEDSAQQAEAANLAEGNTQQPAGDTPQQKADTTPLATEDATQQPAITPDGRFFTLNRDLFLRSAGMIAVYIGFTVIGATLGDVMLAVSAILMKLLMIFSYFTDGFAYAGEALTGRFIGEGSKEGVRDTIRQTFLVSWAVAALFVLAYGLGGTPLLHLMTSDSGVVEAGKAFLPWLMLMPLIGCPAFVWDGIFIGATASADLRNSTLLCAVGFFAVWFMGKALMQPLAPEAGLHILMGAYFMHLAIRSIYLTLRSRSLR